MTFNPQLYNMRGRVVIILYGVYIFLGVVCYSREWPRNIKRCARNETNMNKCLFQSAKSAMSILAKGNKDLGIRSLDPLRLGNMTISNELAPVVCKFQIINGIMEGLSKMVLRNISYNPRRQEMIIEGLHKKLKMSGSYDTIGNIYTLNFKGKGKFIFENKNVQVLHMIKLEPSRKRDYMEMDLALSVRNLGRVRMDFKDTLLPPPARDALSKMVNDNWLEVAEQMMPTFEYELSNVLSKALSPMFRRFPMSTVFPNKT